MEEPGEDLDALAASVIGAALEVHRALGPGFVEAMYQNALCIELARRQIPFRQQVPVGVAYRGVAIGEHRLDLLVDEKLIVELKAIEALGMVHAIQVRSYLKATGLTLGLLLNFNVPVLKLGIKRVILSE
jgi:GxxExxY protein